MPLKAIPKSTDRDMLSLPARLDDRVSDLELERQVMDALNMDPLRVHDFLRFKAATTQLSGDIGVSVIYRNTADYPIMLRIQRRKP